MVMMMIMVMVVMMVTAGNWSSWYYRHIVWDWNCDFVTCMTFWSLSTNLNNYNLVLEPDWHWCWYLWYIWWWWWQWWWWWYKLLWAVLVNNYTWIIIHWLLMMMILTLEILDMAMQWRWYYYLHWWYDTGNTGHGSAVSDAGNITYTGDMTFVTWWWLWWWWWWWWQ